MEEDEEDYNQIIETLYSKLLYDTKKMSDWEYQFINDLYAVKESGRDLITVSDKRKEWMKKLKEKYL